MCLLQKKTDMPLTGYKILPKVILSSVFILHIFIHISPPFFLYHTLETQTNPVIQLHCSIFVFSISMHHRLSFLHDLVYDVQTKQIISFLTFHFHNLFFKSHLNFTPLIEDVLSCRWRLTNILLYSSSTLMSLCLVSYYY